MLSECWPQNVKATEHRPQPGPRQVGQSLPARPLERTQDPRFSAMDRGGQALPRQEPADTRFLSAPVKKQTVRACPCKAVTHRVRGAGASYRRKTMALLFKGS